MKPQPKAVIALTPTSLTNGATSTGQIDTLGFEHVTIDVIATTANVVSNKFSVLKVSESDTTDATNYSDITKFVGGGAGGFTIPNADTSNPYISKFNIQCANRKRYLKVTVSPQTTQTIGVIANLQQAEQAPTTAALAGANALVEG
jgi:hypothetical protein